MTERIERELWLPAPPETVWEVVTGDGWLADHVALELRPGGDAEFDSADGDRATGWVEDVSAPERLTFWWALDDEPASRVELRIEAQRRAAPGCGSSRPARSRCSTWSACRCPAPAARRTDPRSWRRERAEPRRR